MVNRWNAFLKKNSTLWGVTILASLVLLGTLSAGDGDTAAFLIMCGLLVSFFTDNMVIVLGSAVVLSMLYAGSRLHPGDSNRPAYREGFDQKKEPRQEKASIPESKVAGPLQGGESVKATIANLEEILGSGSVDTMSDTTKRLMEQQNMLGQKLENLLPIVQQGMGMLDKVGGTKGINQMIEVLQNFKGGDLDAAAVATAPLANDKEQDK